MGKREETASENRQRKKETEDADNVEVAPGTTGGRLVRLRAR